MSPDFKVVCSDKVPWSNHFTLMHLAAVRWRYTLPSCCSKKKYSSDLLSPVASLPLRLPHPPMKFVSCVWQHQHTPTQLQKTERISFQKVRIFFFFGLLFSATSNDETRDARSGKNKASVYLFVLYVFLFKKQHFVVIFFSPLDFFSFLLPGWKLMITHVDQISWKHLINF